MELIEYLRLLRRWFWLIFITAFLGGSIVYILRSSAVPYYQSSTMLAVGSYISSPNPQTGEVTIGKDLATTYAQLLRTHEVMDAAIKALSLTINSDDLVKLISTQIITGTSLLVVQVKYTDPILTADIANELARQLILLSPTNLTPEQQAQIQIAEDQIAALRAEIDNLRLELSGIDEALGKAKDQDTIDNLTAQRNVIYEQITQRSGNIASFTTTIASYQQRTNAVEIQESAQIPEEPISNSPVAGAILGAVTGAALAFGVGLVLEYFNDTFRTNDEVIQFLSLPVLGVIATLGRKKGDYQERLITHDLFSQAHEQYRVLRTNVLLRTPKSALPIYSITSAIPSEGKTLTTTNLAISMALAEMKVLLIDADLRKPRLHEIFNLPNETGLSTLLSNQPAQTDSTSYQGAIELVDKNTEWIQGCVQEVGIPNLKVMTSGHIPNNPAELLGSTQMKLWSQMLRQIFDVDVVFFDTPPSLLVSDSTILAANAETNVLLVIEANSTRRTAVLRAKERFTNVNYPIMGAILNNVNTRDENYYGYGYGYYNYYGSEPSKAQNQK